TTTSTVTFTEPLRRSLLRALPLTLALTFTAPPAALPPVARATTRFLPRPSLFATFLARTTRTATVQAALHEAETTTPFFSRLLAATFAVETRGGGTTSGGGVTVVRVVASQTCSPSVA